MRTCSTKLKVVTSFYDLLFHAWLRRLHARSHSPLKGEGPGLKVNGEGSPFQGEGPGLKVNGTEQK